MRIKFMTYGLLAPDYAGLPGRGTAEATEGSRSRAGFEYYFPSPLGNLEEGFQGPAPPAATWTRTKKSIKVLNTPVFQKCKERQSSRELDD